MTLTNLIQELKEATENKEIPRQEVGNLIDGRIELPDDFNISHDSVEFEDMNFGNKGDAPLYHLLVSGFPKRTLDDVQPVLDEVFSRARGIRLDKGTADVKYGVLWTPEAFQEERKLTGLFFDEVEVASRAYTCDPTKVRIGMPGHSHEIEAKTQGNKMTIKATGKYRGELEGLVERFNPQYAKLNLSKDDAERLLRAVRNNPIGKYVAGRLEKALQPEEKYVMSLLLGGGMSFGTQEVIEIAVPTRVLRQYEDAIKKSLIASSSNQESKVTEFIKVYGLGGLLRGERLSDLQSLATEIQQMDLGIIYGHPMLTNGGARELLDKEIELIGEGYKNRFLFGMNAHMMRGGIVKRLAREHFGEEVLTGFDELNVNDYVNSLKARGYVEPSAESVESETTRKGYAKSRADGKMEDRAFSTEPDYIAKERHLLEFFKQSYTQDPKDSVQKFREDYQSTAPKMRIFARSRSKDASKLRKLRLPAKSRLYEFGITGHMRGKYSNDLSITRTLPSSDDIHFWSRTSVDSPILLPLQEYACKEMGIKFK